MKNRVDNIEELKANDIWVTDNFLSEAECSSIQLLLQSGAWQQSRVVNVDRHRQANEFISDARTSSTCFENGFGPDLKKKVDGIEKRICRQFKLNSTGLEGWQVTKYGYNEGFEPHVDCISEDKHFGLRQKTILLYLCTPDRGGETFFRALNLYVRPLQGRLVIWNNLLPNRHCNYGMMHGSLPVKKGLKIILHTWFRIF